MQVVQATRVLACVPTAASAANHFQDIGKAPSTLLHTLTPRGDHKSPTAMRQHRSSRTR